ncbi:MAG: SsrA-binding protein SmpB [Acholeplasma sp.]|nr:SsrA-binding protein SmpB [Acholeplasma sp.]
MRKKQMKENIVAQNKKARHDYFITQTYEAGIQLKGTEIKSIRQHKANINDAFVSIKNGEIFIVNMHVAPYDHGNLFNHDETRTRKLLMHKKEIIKLEVKAKEDGFTIIPLKLYFNEGLAKLEIAVAKGKKLFDKREDLKEKDAQMYIKKTLKDAFKR